MEDAFAPRDSVPTASLSASPGSNYHEAHGQHQLTPSSTNTGDLTTSSPIALTPPEIDLLLHERSASSQRSGLSDSSRGYSFHPSHQRNDGSLFDIYGTTTVAASLSMPTLSSYEEPFTGFQCLGAMLDASDSRSADRLQEAEIAIAATTGMLPQPDSGPSATSYEGVARQASGICDVDTELSISPLTHTDDYSAFSNLNEGNSDTTWPPFCTQTLIGSTAGIPVTPPVLSGLPCSMPAMLLSVSAAESAPADARWPAIPSTSVAPNAYSLHPYQSRSLQALSVHQASAAPASSHRVSASMRQSGALPDENPTADGLTTAHAEVSCSSDDTGHLKRKRERRQLQPEQRKQRKLVREKRACIICRCYHGKCDVNSTCQECLNKAVIGSTLRERVGCYRETLMDVYPFRRGKAPFGEVEAKLPKLKWDPECPNTCTIRIVRAFTKKDDPAVLDLECRRFCPKNGQITDLYWKGSSGPEHLPLPKYAVYDTSVAKDQMNDFTESIMPRVERYLFEQTSDEISRLIHAEARRFANQRPESAVASALKIYCVALCRDFEVTNGEELGIPTLPEKDAGVASRIAGRRPLPLYVNHQVDIILNNFIIERHRKAVLKRLNGIIFKRDAVSVWYEVFLTTFILLEILEHAHQRQEQRCAWSEGTDEHYRLDYVTKFMLEEWENSAENLIKHFRVVLRGQIPFGQDAADFKDCSDRASLDVESQACMRKVVTILKSQRDKLEDIRTSRDYKFHRPYFWLYQLFYND